MRIPTISAVLSIGSLALAKDHTVAVYTWPFDAKSPSQFASVTYDPDTLSASVKDYSPPSIPESASDTDVRVGLWDSQSSTWRGVLTTLATFDTTNQAKLALHLDDDGEVWHVGISSYGKPKQKKSKKKKQKADTEQKPKRKTKKKLEEEKWQEPMLVEVVKPVRGPSPVLNKPVILDAEGKLPDKADEKTFLQKYWWAIAIFLAVQLLMPAPKSG